MTDVTEAMKQAGKAAFQFAPPWQDVGATMATAYLAMTAARECVDQVEGVLLPDPFRGQAPRGPIQQGNGQWRIFGAGFFLEAPTAEYVTAAWNTRAALPTRSQSPDVEAVSTKVRRLEDALRHSQGRFLNINICLSSGGTKREAIGIADVGEDCIKMALNYDALPVRCVESKALGDAQ